MLDGVGLASSLMSHLKKFGFCAQGSGSFWSWEMSHSDLYLLSRDHCPYSVVPFLEEGEAGWTRDWMTG